MAKYLIHSCNERQWYVDKYLVPSMTEQGIDKGDIDIFQDDGSLGCLEAFMQSLLLLEGTGTWHLQDDVLISSQFKRWTEEYDDGVVCGFCSRYSKDEPAGTVYPNHMWLSFPCIHIPDTLAREFATWFYRETIHNPEYRLWVNKKKYADSIFRIYMEDYNGGMEILNLAPNIVNHIDYVIGGSTINQNRGGEHVTSIYWEEPELLKYWEDIVYG